MRRALYTINEFVIKMERNAIRRTTATWSASLSVLPVFSPRDFAMILHRLFCFCFIVSNNFYIFPLIRINQHTNTSELIIIGFYTNRDILIGYKFNKPITVFIFNLNSFGKCHHTKHISREVLLSGIAVYEVVFSIFTSLPGVLEFTGA